MSLKILTDKFICTLLRSVGYRKGGSQNCILQSLRRRQRNCCKYAGAHIFTSFKKTDARLAAQPNMICGTTAQKIIVQKYVVELTREVQKKKKW